MNTCRDNGDDEPKPVSLACAPLPGGRISRREELLTEADLIAAGFEPIDSIILYRRKNRFRNPEQRLVANFNLDGGERTVIKIPLTHRDIKIDTAMVAVSWIDVCGS